MFFKFSRDTADGMYGGDEFAMKAAGHELKSLNELIACYIPKVHFPLMGILNYLGWRVIVISLLPIHSNTLVYGSADGGKHIFNTNSTMNNIMLQFGNLLNLKIHQVKEENIVGPADLEGHKGIDGRFYIADVSRLFPPAYILHRPQKTHGSIWFRLLRSEFVRQYHTPLSSDAFSGMGIINSTLHNKEVADATYYLESTLIVNFVNNIIDSNDINYTSLNDVKIKIPDLKSIVHKHGINCRYFYLIYLHAKNIYLKQYLLVEIIARVTRKLLWGEMRRLNSRKLIDKSIVTIINNLFGQGDKSNLYWKTTLIEGIKKRFIIATTHDEYKENEFLLINQIVTIVDNNELLLLLFQRLQYLVGVNIYFIDCSTNEGTIINNNNNNINNSNDNININNNNSNWLSKIPITTSDVVISLTATTKSIQVIPYTQTYEKVEDAITFYKQELKARLELLGNNHIQVANIRDHLALLYRIKGRDYFNKAEKQFKKALQIKETLFSPTDIEVASYLDSISQFYLQFGEYAKTESLLQRSLEIKKQVLGTSHASIAKTLDQIAQVHRKQGQYETAKPIFKQALNMLQLVVGSEDPSVATTSYNLALLYRQIGKYNKAEPLYHKALVIMETRKGPDHSWVSKILSNLAQLYQLQGRYEEAEPLFERCIKIKKKELGAAHLDTATTKFQLAQLYHKQKKYAAAGALYKEALSIRETLLGSGHYAVGKVLDKLADLEREQKNNSVANKYYTRALTVLEKSLNSNHPYFKSFKEKYDHFKKELLLEDN